MNSCPWIWRVLQKDIPSVTSGAGRVPPRVRGVTGALSSAKRAGKGISNFAGNRKPDSKGNRNEPVEGGFVPADRAAADRVTVSEIDGFYGISLSGSIHN